MHEVSLNRVITDYISGQEIMDTTYEDLRQALARMLVEDRKYPKAVIRPKYEATYEVGECRRRPVSTSLSFPRRGTRCWPCFSAPGRWELLCAKAWPWRASISLRRFPWLRSPTPWTCNSMQRETAGCWVRAFTPCRCGRILQHWRIRTPLRPRGRAPGPGAPHPHGLRRAWRPVLRRRMQPLTI